MQQGSIIKKIDNLGEMALPFRMRSAKKEIFREGRYYYVCLTYNLSLLKKITADFIRVMYCKLDMRFGKVSLTRISLIVV